MLIHKLKLNYFGRFHNREIQLKPGINIIYGDNEAGKSTIHMFIKGMLFGIERMRGRGSASKEDTYTRYLPWDYPGAYGGSMDIVIDDKEYRLGRSFHAHDKNFKITELASGREIDLKEGLISELIPGLTEATFKNTVSIEQLKASTDHELVTQVRNYIANLSIAKSKEIHVAKAVATLTEQKKKLDPTQKVSLLKALELQIEEGVRKEEKIDQLMLRLKELESEEQDLIKIKEHLSAELNEEEKFRMEQFPAMVEKYNSFLELTKRTELLDQQEEELKWSIVSLEKERYTTDQLKDTIKEVERLKTELMRLEQEGLDLHREKTTEGTAIHPFAISIPVVSFSLVIMTVFDFKPVGLALGAILLGIGVLLHFALNKNRKKGLIIRKRRIAELSSERILIQKHLEELLRSNGVTHSEELIHRQEEILKSYYSLEHAKKQRVEIEQNRKSMEDNKDLLYESIMKYMQYFLREEELTQSAMQRLQEEIIRRRQDSQDRLEKINRQLEECKLRIEKVRWELGALEGNEGRLMQDREQYAQLEKKIKEENLELEAINLALTTIQKLSVEIHDSFGKQLNEAVTEVISEVTSQRYQELKVDEKLEIKLGWNGDYVMLDKLSAGTIDQVYFALRLAVADLLLGKDTVPLILDDSFAYYDETRVKSSLKKIAQRKQVILFTCHKREEQLLKELCINYHLVDLSC